AEMAEVEDTLGMVHAARGRFDLAAGEYARSLARKSILGDREGMAITLGNLGRVHLQEKRLEEALACFELDLEISTEIGDQRGCFRMQIDIATVMRLQDRWDGVEPRLVAAISAARAASLPRLEFDGLRELAMLHLARRRFVEAQRAIDDARAVGQDLEGGFFA